MSDGCRRLFAAAAIALACLSSASCSRTDVAMHAAARETRPPSNALRKAHQPWPAGLGVGDVDPSDVRRGSFLIVAGILTGVVVVRSSSAVFPFVIWTAALATVTVPWRDLHQTTGHYVAWIPFVSPPVRLVDIAANIVMFLPFGALYIRWRPHDAGRLLVWAALFSVSVEVSQLFSRGRVTSTTDVATNLIGAMTGAFAWRFLATWRVGRALSATP
jgi:VanZ family protein